MHLYLFNTYSPALYILMYQYLGARFYFLLIVSCFFMREEKTFRRSTFSSFPSIFSSNLKMYLFLFDSRIYRALRTPLFWNNIFSFQLLIQLQAFLRRTFDRVTKFRGFSFFFVRFQTFLTFGTVLCPNLMNLSRVSNPLKTGFN